MPAVVTCCDLTLRRGRKRLIANLSFDLAGGELLHVRGPNGVGKSTLLSALVGLAPPEHGTVTLAPQCRIAWLGHKIGLCSAETPHEALQLRASLHGSALDAVDDALDKLGVAHLAHRPVGQLSAGQQRRVALAGVLLQGANLWVLDEPLNALDIAGVAGVEALLQAHVDAGGAAIVTSHQALTLDKVRSLDLERTQ
ncbi:heme ABC exporter ATP-binding protein CcmA [bacterium]|nr:heme ABC exporter ATP-binding protein CcmA [bacterium]